MADKQKHQMGQFEWAVVLLMTSIVATLVALIAFYFSRAEFWYYALIISAGATAALFTGAIIYFVIRILKGD